MSALQQSYPTMWRCGCVPSRHAYCLRAQFLDREANDLFARARESVGKPLYAPLRTNAERARRAHAMHLAGQEPNDCVFCGSDRGEGHGLQYDLCFSCAQRHYD